MASGLCTTGGHSLSLGTTKEVPMFFEMWRTVTVPNLDGLYLPLLDKGIVWLSNLEKEDYKHCGFPRWYSRKESICQWGRHRRFKFNPWIRKIPWRRKYPLMTVIFFFFFLENPMDRGACWATVGGVAKNRIWLSMNKQTPSVRNFIIPKYRHKMTVEGTSLVIQWLRYHTLSEENPGSISGQGTRFHMPQLRVLMLQQRSKISHTATKTQSNQINTYNNDFF